MGDGPTLGRHRFIGRVRELATIRRATPTTKTGAHLLVVNGVGGIGKTHLLAEALTAGGSNLTVVTCRCSQRIVGPLDVIVSLTSRLGLSHSIDGVDENPNKSGPDDLTNEGTRHQRVQLLSTIAADVVELSKSEPLVLVVDDLHWCHPDALTFFESLVDELDRWALEAHLLVVFVSRPLPEGHDVRLFLERVQRLPYSSGIALEGLGSDDEASVVRSIDSQASPALMSLVRRSANGNPLHARAVLAVARQRQIDEPSSAFDPRLLGRIAVSLDVNDPVTAWLLDLDPVVSETLSTCAVFDDEFSHGDALSLCAAPSSTTTAALDEAMGSGILNSDGQVYWFAHPQYREVLYQMLGIARLSEVHIRCAELLHARSSLTPRDDIAIGNHLLTGRGETSLSRLDAYVRAGEASLKTASWGEAARYFEAALQAAASAALPPPSGLRLSTGRAHYFNHDPAQAERHLRLALSEARAEGDEESHCAALVHLMWCANSMGPGSLHEPIDRVLVDEFLATAHDQRLRSRALEVLAEAQITLGELDDGGRTAAAALTAAAESGDGQAKAFAQFALGYGHLSGAEIGRAIEVITEAGLTAAGLGDWYLQSGVNARLAYALLASGDLERADAVAVESMETARHQAEYSAQVLAGVVRSAVSVSRGDYRSAGHLIDQVAAHNAKAHHNAAPMFIVPLEVMICLRHSSADAAREVLARKPGLRGALASSLVDLVDAVDGVDRHPQLRIPRRPTLVGAAVLAVQSEAALLRSDNETLLRLGPKLRELERQGMVVPPGYPVLLSRLVGDVESMLGADERAAGARARAEVMAERNEMYPELALTLLGSAQAEGYRPGGSREKTRRAAADALGLAEKIGLPFVHARASAILRQAIDSPAAVEARGGAWRVILSSDVEGSTAISSDHGDLAYHDVVTRHHALVRGVCRRRGGTEFSDGGDGLMLWFEDTISAIEAATEIQNTLAAGASSHLAIKIGLSGGEPLFRDGRPYGLVVNRAARMESEAGGGQIFLDEAVTAHLGDAMETEDRGPVDLKGIGPHRITELLYSRTDLGQSNRTNKKARGS